MTMRSLNFHIAIEALSANVLGGASLPFWRCVRAQGHEGLEIKEEDSCM